MQKKIHPQQTLTKFKCATCGTEFELLSTVKDKNVALDVCSKCHPFYNGTAGQQSVKGRAEKLASKFSAGMDNLNNKAPKKVKVQNKKDKKIITSLEDINL